MAGLEELDATVTLGQQLQTEEGPVVLVNIFTIDPADEEALLEAWAHDADFMKKQSGYISTQMQKGIAGSSPACRRGRHDHCYHAYLDSLRSPK